MGLRAMLGGAICALVATLLPAVPTTGSADILKHVVVGGAGIVSQVTVPASAPLVVAQIVKSAWDGNSTPSGVVTSLSMVAGATITMKTIKKVMGGRLSTPTAIRLVQEVGTNTISAAMPLMLGGLLATAIGWQNVARVHNAVVLPMLVPGIAILTISKLATSKGAYKDILLALGGGVLAITASQYHPLAIGVVLGAVHTFHKGAPFPKRELHRGTFSGRYALSIVSVPQWVNTCMQLGTSLIGIPVSQLYPLMGTLPDKGTSARYILDGVVEGVEVLTSIVFYLLWGMAREGSFTDPVSKALNGGHMEWYIPVMGMVLVVATMWYLFHYVQVSIPLYLECTVRDATTNTIGSIGLLVLGAHLLTVPLWLPAMGLLLGWVAFHYGIDVSLMGSTMPLLGIVGGGH
jgi:hypothetical protein